MTESEAKVIITDTVKDIAKAEKIRCIERKPISRLEDECVFGVLFKSDEEVEQEVIRAVKDLSFLDPNFRFHGSDVDNKFDLEFVMIFISATTKTKG